MNFATVEVSIRSIHPIHRFEQTMKFRLSAESAGNHSPIGSRFHHAFSPIGANR